VARKLLGINQKVKEYKLLSASRIQKLDYIVCWNTWGKNVAPKERVQSKANASFLTKSTRPLKSYLIFSVIERIRSGSRTKSRDGNNEEVAPHDTASLTSTMARKLMIQL
jgi:hypothetical protein